MFKFPEELTIAQANECKVQLIEFIDEHDEIVFDDSEVKRVDTVGIQLLLTAVIYIVTLNKVLHWKNESTIIKESIQRLGINEPILNQYL